MSRWLGLLIGVTADAALGDPRRGHPVAVFGGWAARAEQALHSDNRAAGAWFAAVTLAPVLAVGCCAERMTRRHPAAHTLVTAAATWAVLGGRSLIHEGRTMAAALESGDLAGARAQLPHLCGRRPDALDAPELARATVESLAENASDAVICSLFWGAVAGIPGLLVHRAVNTLDAMVGHRNPRYARFGTASARLDDLLALAPSRITGALACALAPSPAAARRAWRTMLRDARRHPSPNGGWCEAAWAGALDVRLGGSNVYGDRVEVRGTLGDPGAPLPDAGTVRAATRLVARVSAAAAVLAAGAALAGAVRSR